MPSNYLGDEVLSAAFAPQNFAFSPTTLNDLVSDMLAKNERNAPVLSARSVQLPIVTLGDAENAGSGSHPSERVRVLNVDGFVHAGSDGFGVRDLTLPELAVAIDTASSERSPNLRIDFERIKNEVMTTSRRVPNRIEARLNPDLDLRKFFSKKSDAKGPCSEPSTAASTPRKKEVELKEVEKMSSVEIAPMNSTPTRLDNVPDEILCEICSYLPAKDLFTFCIAANRKMPQVWGVTLSTYSRDLSKAQSACEDMAILTEMATDGQQESQALWFTTVQRRRMLLEDARTFDNNRGRFEVDLDELLTQEKENLNKFEACVEVLKKTMAMWSEKGKDRDAVSTRCQQFHKSVRIVF